MIHRQIMKLLHIHTDLPLHHNNYHVFFLIIIITTLYTLKLMCALYLSIRVVQRINQDKKGVTVSLKKQ